jgi:sigma-B regulation protein RsbU (phosphoserine phosphatase)
VHEGEQWAGERATASVLAVPLVTAQHQQSLGSLVLLGRAGARFTAGDAALGSTIGQQLARGVENERLITSLREKERIEREMELAGAVQRQLLPAQAPHVEGVSLAAACLPAEHVGGDYFDFVPSEHSVTALVADVSGHGVGPGLMMAMTRTVLRRELQQGVSLADALRATSTLMWDDLAATGLFITVFCIRYEPATRTLRYVNGGHHPALLRRAGGTTAGLDGDGWPLGLIPDPDFEEHSLVLDAGDAVLVFSDGIVEERSPTGEMFGTDRLTQLVTGTAGPLLQPLLDAARGWRGPALQQDDVTLLELRVAPEGDGR